MPKKQKWEFNILVFPNWYTLSTSIFFFQYWGLNSRPSPWASQFFFVIDFFQIGSHKLFVRVGFKLRSSWSLPPEDLGLQVWAPGSQLINIVLVVRNIAKINFVKIQTPDSSHDKLTVTWTCLFAIFSCEIIHKTSIVEDTEQLIRQVYTWGKLQVHPHFLTEGTF
jgi:hypothetical protein